MRRINTDSKYYQAIMDADTDLKFPERYIGKLRNKIIIRSFYEYKFITDYCDSATSPIIKWSSEEQIVHYKGKDGRLHRYFLDFYIELKNGKKVKTYLIEIKPYEQVHLNKNKVKKMRRKKAQYLLEQYEKNLRKWQAAEKWCNKKGWIFKIITEKELGI